MRRINKKFHEYRPEAEEVIKSSFIKRKLRIKKLT